MSRAGFPLHRVALQAAQTLPRGAFAVAVTGSVARGNWHAASDVDLWVLGPRNACLHTYVRGHPVTYLMETLREAGSFPRMCRCEVPDIWVLRDPAGHLAALKERAIRARSRIKRAVTRATLQTMLDAVERSSAGSEAHQICWLREAAWRAAALEGWHRKGWHASKFRHLAQLLDPLAVVQLKAILGVPLRRGAWRALNSHWPPFVRAFARGRRAHSLLPVLKDPGHLFSKAKLGLPIDAVVEARQALEADLPAGVWAALQQGLEPPRQRRPLPPGLAAVWAALHGFVPAEPGPREVRTVRSALARLLRRLPASRHLASKCRLQPSQDEVRPFDVRNFVPPRERGQAETCNVAAKSGGVVAGFGLTPSAWPHHAPVASAKTGGAAGRAGTKTRPLASFCDRLGLKMRPRPGT